MSELFCCINKDNNLSQKCTLFPKLFISMKARIGDYIKIELTDKILICKLFLRSCQIKDLVVADDVVFIPKHVAKFDGTSCIRIIPENLVLCSRVDLATVKVRLVFKKIEKIFILKNKEKIKLAILKILWQYGIANGAVIQCENHLIAKTIGLFQIHIIETFQDSQTIGTVSPRTQIVVSEILTKNHLLQTFVNDGKYFSGTDSILSDLKFLMLCHSKCSIKHDLLNKVLLTGPSGCGKSSAVKHLAHFTNSYLITMEDIMSHEDEDYYFQNIFNILNTFNLSCILFFDDLDKIKFEKQNKKLFCLIIKILELSQKYKNIFVIASAKSSKFIKSELRKPRKFIKEIHIGIPTYEQRTNILSSLTNGLSSEELDVISRKTPGYNCTDLYSLCEQASEYLVNDENRNSSNDKETFSVSVDTLEKALNSIKPSILKHSEWFLNLNPVQWDDIGGMETIKRKIKMRTEWPLLYPEVFMKLGLPCPRGVLLFGPPGCCKTTLVRAAATECDANFLSANPAQVFKTYVGDSEKSIVELFHCARQCAPCIIFLDEIDSLVGKREYDSKNVGVQEKVLSALLNEMDGFGISVESLQGTSKDKQLEGEKKNLKQTLEYEQKLNNNVLVIAATNRPDLVDEALLRPGRFDVLLYIPPPDAEDREAILRTLTRNMKMQDVDLKWLAKKTEFFTGADLKNLCFMAGREAIKKLISGMDTFITMEHFFSALEEVRPSISSSQLQMYEELAVRCGRG